MKNYISILAALSAIMAGGIASAYTISGFRAAPAVDLTLPQLPDSLGGENAFSVDRLLDARRAFEAYEVSRDWTTMGTDTAGRVTLVKGVDVPRLNSFSTRLRAEKFCKGKLILNTAGIADLLVNGKSVAKKSVTDSLPSDISAPLDLSPEGDYEIQVNIISTPDEKGEADFKLEFVPDEKYGDVTLLSGSDLKRRVSALTTMIGERVSGVSVSPDGKYMIVRTREVVSATETYRRASVVETSTGKTIAENINPDCEWLPSGSSLYHTVKTPKGYDLIKQTMPQMASVRIASGVPENDFMISPDMKYLFYYTQVEGDRDEGVMRRVRRQDDRIPGDRDRAYVMRYDMTSGVSTPVTYGGPTTTILDFSRDGSKMIYFTIRQTPSEYPFYLNSIIQVDTRTLKTDTIIKDNGYVNNAVYSPDGRKLFVVGSPQAFGEKGINSGEAEIPNAFDNQGYIYDIASGDVKAVTRDFDPSLSGTPVWNAADGNIYFLAQTGFHEYVYCLNPKNGSITQLESKIGAVRNFSIGKDEGKWMAWFGGDFTTEGEAYLMNLKTGKTTQIADPMRAMLDGIQFGKMEQWQFKASDGTMIDGYFCLPPDFDPAKKYPMIVYYYAGTSPSEASMWHLYSPQLFASRDYVVYVLNPSGTFGYGQEFSARHVNAWGKRTADDIIEGTKEFCRQHKFVDDKKIGCIGASYGGFMTQYLQTLTDIFAAAVSHAGISDVTSYWGEGFWGYSYNSVAAAKSYPWNNPELYTKQGSLFNADKIHTPLLLLHGKLDTNVPIGESIQIFNALRVLGRDVEFITVEDENHVISNFDRKQLWQNTIMAWFAKYLQDDPRWWNELYGK